MVTKKERRPTPDEIPPQQLEYPAGKLEGKVAFITGADSGIDRAVAIAYAREGAEVAIFYNVNDGDAEKTK